jgi:hypothetical protein
VPKGYGEKDEGGHKRDDEKTNARELISIQNFSFPASFSILSPHILHFHCSPIISPQLLLLPF